MTRIIYAENALLINLIINKMLKRVKSERTKLSVFWPVATTCSELDIFA